MRYTKRHDGNYTIPDLPTDPPEAYMHNVPYATKEQLNKIGIEHNIPEVTFAVVVDIESIIFYVINHQIVMIRFKIDGIDDYFIDEKNRNKIANQQMRIFINEKIFRYEKKDDDCYGLLNKTTVGDLDVYTMELDGTLRIDTEKYGGKIHDVSLHFDDDTIITGLDDDTIITGELDEVIHAAIIEYNSEGY